MPLGTPTHTVITSSPLPSRPTSVKHEPDHSVPLACQPKPLPQSQSGATVRVPPHVIFCPLPSPKPNSLFFSFYLIFLVPFGFSTFPGDVLPDLLFPPAPNSTQYTHSFPASVLLVSCSGTETQSERFPEPLSKTFHVVLCCFLTPVLQNGAYTVFEI